MSAKTSNFKLGLFVIAATTLGVCGLVMLGAGSLLRETYTFETYIDETVQGLDVGAPVKIRGVKIGSVSKITFVDSKYALPDSTMEERRYYAGTILVEFKVDRERLKQRGMSSSDIRGRIQSSVEAGLRARMASSGLTGPPFITVEFMDPEEFVPMEITWEPDHIYIPSAPSTHTRFISAAEDILHQVQRAGIENIATDVRNVLEEIDAKVGEIDAQEISDEVVEMIKELRETNAKIKGLMEDKAIAQAIDGLPEAIQSVQRLMRRLDNIVVSERDDLEAIIGNLQQITDNLEQLTEDLKEAPSQTIFGAPPPKE